jgi:NADP-dependent 3-hydroxy acid dehydrogenase YdfG
MTDTQIPGPFAAGTAVVTGGGSGLGRVLAHQFAEQSMHVVIADRNYENAERVAAELPSATAFPLDLADVDSINAVANDLAEVEGNVQVLCANVGVQELTTLDRMTLDDWRWMTDVNVIGTVATVQAFLPLLREASGLRRILLTCSTSSVYAAPRMGGYTATKYAVMGYGETLRAELAPEGIGVTMLLPSGMATTHLQSSAAARPAAIGPSLTTDDDLEVVITTMASEPDSVATAEHAARHVIDALVDDRPYLVTHGATPTALQQRFRAILDAFAHADD